MRRGGQAVSCPVYGGSSECERAGCNLFVISQLTGWFFLKGATRNDSRKSTTYLRIMSR